MKQILIFLSLLTIACSTEPIRQFNIQHDDGACFLVYGYAPGYCSIRSEL